MPAFPPPNHNRQTTNDKRRRLRRARWIAAAAALLALAVIGPWPAWDRPFQEPEYRRATLRGLEASPVLSGPGGPLRAGFGSAELPLPAEPSGSWPRHNLFATRGPGSQGAERLQTYALAISDGTHTLSLVSADLLLITPAIVDATLAGLRETGPPVERAWIYFGATHTHSGPGGLGDGILEQVMMGRYRHGFVRETGRRMAAAIRQATQGLTPAEVGHAAVSVPEPLGNRLAPGGSVDANLDILAARRAAGRPLATVVAYAAHPTTLGGEPRGPSADYPGALARWLQERTGAPVLFLAGAVGSMTVVRDDLRGSDGADRLGVLLAEAAAGALPRIAYRREGRLASLRFPVYLPTPQVRLTRRLALSPVLPWLFLPRAATLQAVAVNDLVMVGIPGEYSGEESLAVREAGRTRGLQTLVTSLNGEYAGYIIPDARYWTENYETRWTTYGPHLGSYFRAVIGAAVARVAALPTAPR